MRRPATSNLVWAMAWAIRFRNLSCVERVLSEDLAMQRVSSCGPKVRPRAKR